MITRILTIAALLTLAAVCVAEEFPYRAEYDDCRPIATDELARRLDAGDVVVVDVRSKIEYDVIHVDGAVHIPVAHGTFAKQVADLAAANPGSELAFYCNGVTCLKSYKATRKAMAAGIADVLAYDAGIPAWATAYPERTLLLGETVTYPESQIIAKATFKERCVDYEAFKTMAAGDNAIVVDVREPLQRGTTLENVGAARPIPLDVFIPNFVAKGEAKDKTVLIYDQVGKQVRWLMYYLENQGYENYWFLDGGVLAVNKEQSYRS